MRHSVRLYGLPSVIVSDRDTRFMSDFWQEVWTNLGSKLKPSAPFHPQTDGQAEKANAIISRYLRAFATKYGLEWDQVLALGEFSYNATRHSSTGVSPFELDLGYTPSLPVDLISRAVVRGGTRSATGAEFMERLSTILQTARTLLREAQSHQVAAHKVRLQSDIATGDEVLLSTKHLPTSYGNVATNGSRKLQHAFAGLFKVLSVRGNAATLELSRDLGIDPTQNVGYLKKYIPTNDEWAILPPSPLRQAPTGAVHEVEDILDHARSGTNQKNWSYLVRWRGFDDSHNEWLSSGKLAHSKELVDRYHDRHGLERMKWSMTRKERAERDSRARKVKRVVLRVGVGGKVDGEDR